MAHRVKCPTCNSCLAPQWVLPNRYYYCDFCRVYYGGRDGALYLVPNQQVYNEIKANQEKNESSYSRQS